MCTATAATQMRRSRRCTGCRNAHEEPETACRDTKSTRRLSWAPTACRAGTRRSTGWSPWPVAAGDFADAQLRATQAAILEQESAGIDVITGGEMHRRTHNRHAPPNAMLNHFWQKIPSFQGETKPKPITPHDPNVFHPAAICRGPVIDSVDLGLVDEFKTVSAFARKPVKITMTGPHFLRPSPTTNITAMTRE